MTNPAQYRCVTTWRVRGTSGEVADVLRDPLDLPRWWPAVYLGVEELEPPDDRGLGQRVRARAKGWWPQALSCEFVVTESRYPERLAMEVSGDLEGRVVWSIEQDGAHVDVTCDWRVRPGAPRLRTLAALVQPLIGLNHRWAMKQGAESLALELLRRRASTDGARRSLPAPPGPVTYAAVGILAGAAVIGGGIGWLVLRQRRKARRRA